MELNRHMLQPMPMHSLKNVFCSCGSKQVINVTRLNFKPCNVTQKLATLQSSSKKLRINFLNFGIVTSL